MAAREEDGGDGMKRPSQRLIIDAHGIVRFKANSIIRYLIDSGKIDLNAIAAHPFPREDRVQFLQLMGYSLCGFGEHDYVTDRDYEAAQESASKRVKKKMGAE